MHTATARVRPNSEQGVFGGLTRRHCVREAASDLLRSSASTDEDQRLAAEAME